MLSCAYASQALNVVNSIWSKAKITFALNDCVIDKPLDMAKTARSSDVRVLDALSFRHNPDDLVHIYLVNSIANLSAGGASYLDSDPEPSSFVQCYGNDDSNGRAWAHELGHLMTLDHVTIDYTKEREAAALRGNLMVEGLSTGRDLSARQITQAKGSPLVKRFAG
jgi:Metallo-peptidase family M12B Reprolysin-like